MPGSSLDALSHEISLFSKSLDQLNSAIEEKLGTFQKPKKLIAAIDDLENIILIAATSMPEHVAVKAKEAFKNIRNSIDHEDDDDVSLIQLSNRMKSNAELVLKRVERLFDVTKISGNSSNGIIMAQEEERKRISREIHDGPAQTLASLTMRIDYCLEYKGLPEELTAELLELKESVIRSLKDIRRFIFDLRPMALDDLGLIPTLEQFIVGFKKRTGIPIYVDVNGERTSLDPESELSVFRVIQEASNNSVKHAQPSSIHIFLKFDDTKSRLSVVIKDDGIGFDVKKIRAAYGSLKKLGLLSMEERIRLAGGVIEIVSDPGSGTVVSFWIPLKN